MDNTFWTQKILIFVNECRALASFHYLNLMNHILQVLGGFGFYFDIHWFVFVFTSM